MSSPLEGVRVIDWTVWQQGPLGTALLGELGADVIKIEDRSTGDPGRGATQVYGQKTGIQGRNFYFETLNWGKKSIALDLTKKKGKQVVYGLVKGADVFVHNFRQGVPDRLGMDYQTLSQYNPKIVYAVASGWGPKGPDARKPSFDLVAQARSGIMDCFFSGGIPPQRLGGAIADQMGGIMLAYSVLAALVARDRTGAGQEVDVSQLGSMMLLQGLRVNQYLMCGEEPRKQPRTAILNPLNNHYQCKDGRWIALALMQADRYWHDFCMALGIQNVETDPMFSTHAKRAEYRVELIALLDKTFATKTAAEWLQILERNEDFPIALVKSIPDVVEDPQVKANNYIAEFDHAVWGRTRHLCTPISFGKTPLKKGKEAPEFGEHTEKLLLELGYSWEDIVGLKEEQVIP